MRFEDLFKPKPEWKHSDWMVRLAALEKLTDQALLAEIAKNDKTWELRQRAVRKITDQTVLANVARNDKVNIVREIAVNRLADLEVVLTSKTTSSSQTLPFPF